jgi:hypothetical protein
MMNGTHPLDFVDAGCAHDRWLADEFGASDRFLLRAQAALTPTSTPR